MSRSLIPFFILAVLVIVDIYGFTAIKHVFGQDSSRVKHTAYAIYWGSSIFIVLYFIASMILGFRDHSTVFQRYLMGIVIGIFVSKLFLALFLLIQDSARFFIWLYDIIFKPSPLINTSRRVFLEKVSIGLATIPFFQFIYGMIETAYDYQIHRYKIPIAGLPQGLEGVTICQLSDIHSGSFTQIEPLLKAVKHINMLNPDIFVFTGDIVNNRASEYLDYIPLFKQIKAKYGQYSTLGNHDYGDYVEWDSPEQKAENLETLKSYHRDTNWDILCNEHRIIEINGEKLALIGVENWGAMMHFARYGNLAKAYKGTETIHTKILLSHDPSHWDAQVRPVFSDIQLTLSGHTHGMQFGIENKWIKFSPIEWFYKQWAGLYQEGSQYLNVNRGFGYLAYPGRVGIKPEITLITLTKA